MSFGEPALGAHRWTMDEAASRPIIKQALDAGINFFRRRELVLGWDE